MPTEPVAVEKPEYPLYALTTYELRNFRRHLEQAVGYYVKHHPLRLADPGAHPGADERHRHRTGRAHRPGRTRLGTARIKGLAVLMRVRHQ